MNYQIRVWTKQESDMDTLFWGLETSVGMINANNVHNGSPGCISRNILKDHKVIYCNGSSGAAHLLLSVENMDFLSGQLVPYTRLNQVIIHPVRNVMIMKIASLVLITYLTL